jgi:hypothetical protein
MLSLNLLRCSDVSPPKVDLCLEIVEKNVSDVRVALRTFRD